MDKKFECEICRRKLKSEDGLEAHKKTKHPETKKSGKKIHIKKIRNWGIFIAVLGLIFYGIFWAATAGNVTNVDESNLDFTAPAGEIHWHPNLKIIINGEEQKIPENIGITNSVHFPTHTHEDADSGVLHMENNNPTKRTVTLGYFFEVWGKTLNSECIFNNCTDEGELTMTVNGEKNTEFQNYFMQDGDNIIINYTSN